MTNAIGQPVGGADDYRLFNPKHFGILAALFSLLLPGVLYSLNSRRLEGGHRWLLYILGFVIVEAPLLSAAIRAPDSWNPYAKYVFEAINISIGAVLYARQKASYEQWLLRGLKPRSLIAPIAIAAVPVGLLVWFVVVGAAQTTAPSYELNGNKAYYTSGVTASEAQAFAEGLAQLGFFPAEGEKRTVLIEKDGNGYTVLVPIKKDYWGSAEASDLVRQISAAIAAYGPVPGPISVYASDTSFQKLK